MIELRRAVCLPSLAFIIGADLASLSEGGEVMKRVMLTLAYHVGAHILGSAAYNVLVWLFERLF